MIKWMLGLVEWIQDLWKQIRGIIGLIPPDPPPGCTHSHVWQRLVLLNLILTPAKPYWQPRQPIESHISELPDQLQGWGGEGAAGTESSLQHPWSSLCCVKHKKGQERGNGPTRCYLLLGTGSPFGSPDRENWDCGAHLRGKMALLSV